MTLLVEIVPEMTYNVSSRTLNPTVPKPNIPHYTGEDKNCHPGFRVEVDLFSQGELTKLGAEFYVQEM